MRYSKIDQHLARHFLYYVERISSPPPFLCSQIITPFLLIQEPSEKRVGILAK